MAPRVRTRRSRASPTSEEVEGWRAKPCSRGQHWVFGPYLLWRALLLSLVAMPQLVGCIPAESPPTRCCKA